jgi:hypothetical protein
MGIIIPESHRIAYLTDDGSPIKLTAPAHHEGELEIAALAVREYHERSRELARMEARQCELVSQRDELAEQRDELCNMLQRMVDETSSTRVAPEGILASAPCLLTLEHARAALAKLF